MKIFFIAIIAMLAIVACTPSPVFPGKDVCDSYNGTTHKVSKCCSVCIIENNSGKYSVFEYNGTIMTSKCQEKQSGGLVYASAYC